MKTLFVRIIWAIFALISLSAIPVSARVGSAPIIECSEPQSLNGSHVKKKGCTLPPFPVPSNPGPTVRDIIRNMWYGTTNDVFANGSNVHQIVETAPSVNVTSWQDWCDWRSDFGRQACTESMIRHLIEAKALGVNEAIIGVGYLVYNNVGWEEGEPFRCQSEAIARPGLRSLFAQLRKNGVIDMIRVFYPMDEPGLYGITDEGVLCANTMIREEAAKFEELNGTKIGVIQAPRNKPWPGTKYYDIIGFDDYSQDEGVLRSYPDLEREYPDKQFWLVPGPSFGDRAQPFYDYALSHPKVWGVFNFAYFEVTDHSFTGVVSNGKAWEYCMMGKRFMNPTVLTPDCVSPRPVVSLTVNGSHEATVPVGGMLHYTWSANGGTNFGSYWTSSNPACSYGLLGGQWSAKESGGGYSFAAEPAQAGCTYSVTFAACGPGQSCGTDHITVTITP